MTEYVVLVGTVSIGLLAALASFGPAVADGYEQTRTAILRPYP